MEKDNLRRFLSQICFSVYQRDFSFLLDMFSLVLLHALVTTQISNYKLLIIIVFRMDIGTIGSDRTTSLELI